MAERANASSLGAWQIKKTASQVSRPRSPSPSFLQPPPRQRMGPRGEMTEPGLEEPRVFYFLFQIINNDDSSLPLALSAPFTELKQEEAMGIG